MNRFDLIVLTFSNCIRLRTFRYWSVLFNEFPHKVNRSKGKSSCFSYNMYTGVLSISIGKDQGNKEKNTALLHEIGHYINYSRIKASNEFERAIKHSRTPDTKEEKNAWKWTIRLSDKYGLDICHKTAQRWLSTYNTEYRVLDNLVRLNKKAPPG